MTTARIYYYPEEDARLREVDLGRLWSELADGDPADLAIARSGDGARVVTTFGSSRTVRVLMEYLNDYDVVQELQAVANHLRRNGVIAVAEVGTATWGGFAKQPPERGDTVIKIEENLWALWSLEDIDVGDVVVVRGGGLDGRWEEVTITAINAAKKRIEITPALRFDYSQEPWVLVHDRRFWPYLRASDSQLGAPIISNDHRITWNFEVQLEEARANMAAGVDAEGPFTSTSTGGASYELLSGPSFDAVDPGDALRR